MPKRNAFERRRYVHAQRGFPYALQQTFHQVVDVLALDERHLDVDLRKFKLPVRALVFIAETACELVIALDAGDHQDLLELLRRLRQRVKRSGLAAVRHEKLACALRR
jgi:hypothetical protein